MTRRFGAVLFTGLMLWCAAEPAHAQGVSGNFSDGSVIVGTDATACGPALAGALRYNSVSNLHQYCDGTDWTGLVAFAPVATLSILPDSRLNMDVTGPGTPAYGSTESFQVQNYGAVASSALTVNFSDPSDNFDVVTDGCTGQVLTQNATCVITIRAKSSANGIMQATLTIPHENGPSALLRGTASGFGCAPGTPGGGGMYVTCGAYNLVTTPGGCTSSATPTCPGTTDSLIRLWSGQATDRFNTTSQSDGPQNSVNLMGYALQEGPGTHPGAEYCMDMVYGGYDDWYLPSTDEVSAMYTARIGIGGWANSSYMTSRQSSPTYYYYISNVGSVVNTGVKYSGGSLVRCARRETQALPPLQADTLPDLVYFPPIMTTTTNRVTSSSVSISGINQDVSVALSNDTSGGARMKINGGAEVTSGTVGYGDTIRLVMTSPGSAGNANTVDLAIGSFSTQWRVGVQNATGTRRVFVSESSQGSLGGFAGANARCQSEATVAGLPGTWIAMISDRYSLTDYVANRMDFNWATLRNMNGDLIANGWSDLWDGSIANPINYDENGIIVTSNLNIFSDAGINGMPGNATNDNCLNWGTTSSVYGYNGGTASSTAPSWIATGFLNCSVQGRLYCFENTGGPADTTPVAFEFNPMTKQAAASANDVPSPTVTVTGIDAAAAISISGAGNPEYSINGGAWTSSDGTINNNNTLTIRADAPASNGSRNKVMLTVGTYTTYWYVGAGDTALTKRIFVHAGVGHHGYGVGVNDSRCVSAASAAGLGTNWAAVISDTNVDGYAVNRAPVNWGTLKNLNDEVVAVSWEDMWDGAITGPVLRDENYQHRVQTVFTGSTVTGRNSGSDCVGWTSGSSSIAASAGTSGSSSAVWISGSGGGNCYTSSASSVYCIETGVNAPDTTPTAFYFQPMTTQAAASATDVPSSVVTVLAISPGTAVSVSGTGNPEYRVNGGAWTSAPGTIGHNDTLTVRADAPGTANQRNKVTVTVGTYVTYFYVGAGNTANTKRVFVTSGTYNGARGGVGGADATCSAVANAAGLGTGWSALLGDSSVDGYVVNRAPLNWGTLTNMNGGVVAVSWEDLWDGSVSSPINRTETNTIVNNYTWTGFTAAGLYQPGYGGGNCLNWTTNSNANANAFLVGNSGSSGSWANVGGNTCDNFRQMYCIEQ